MTLNWREKSPLTAVACWRSLAAQGGDGLSLGGEMMVAAVKWAAGRLRALCPETGSNPMSGSIVAKGPQFTSFSLALLCSCSVAALIGLSCSDSECSETESVTNCGKSIGCSLFGWCTSSAGECRTVTDSDCRHNDSNPLCVDWVPVDNVGECTRCVRICAGLGQCSAKDGNCWALHDEDCRKSSRCASDGECVAQIGVCWAGNDADCLASEACKSRGKCRFAPGEGRYELPAELTSVVGSCRF